MSLKQPEAALIFEAYMNTKPVASASPKQKQRIIVNSNARGETVYSFHELTGTLEQAIQWCKQHVDGYGLEDSLDEPQTHNAWYTNFGNSDGEIFFEIISG